MTVHTTKIAGWIHQYVSTDPDATPNFSFWTWKSTSEDWIPVAEHTVEVEVHSDPDALIQAAVASLKGQQDKALAEYIKTRDEISDRLSKLLALPSPKAFSADSVGGAEVDEFPEPPNDGFSPDETSFG
jgi:hypothetical protein